MADELTEICAELQALQRTRAGIIKSRIMAENNRRAFVANTLGYSAGLDEKLRMRMFADADAVIASIVDDDADHRSAVFVRAAELGIASFLHAQKATEKEMLPLVKRTPVAEWVLLPAQKGFGLLSLAVVIGETGDLRLYANPGKLWRRLGCAPWEFGGKTQMGSTWKSRGGLNAEQWSAFGYSPRRRSIAYVIGENLVKQNMQRTAGECENCRVTEPPLALPGKKNPTGRGDSRADTENRGVATGGKKKARSGAYRNDAEGVVAAAGTKKTGGGDSMSDTERVVAAPGPYRLRYDTAKADCALKHTDYSKLRCHRHGMLLATKLLLKNLWKSWNPAFDRGEWVVPELVTEVA